MEGQAIKRCLAISMFALLAVSGVAHGRTIIAFEFVAEVVRVGDGLAGQQFPIGGTFSGIFRFDAELQDQDPFGDHFGEYEPLGPGHVTVESGQVPDAPNYLALFSGSRGRISVINDVFGDSYSVTVAGFLQSCNGIRGPGVNGFDLCGFELDLLDEDGLGFDSDALPLSPPDLEQFENAFVTLEFRQDRLDLSSVVGRISSLSLSSVSVPEPGTLALLGLGLLGLGGVTRRCRAA